MDRIKPPPPPPPPQQKKNKQFPVGGSKGKKKICKKTIIQLDYYCVVRVRAPRGMVVLFFAWGGGGGGGGGLYVPPILMHFEFEFWGFGAPRYHLQGVGAPCHQEPLDPHQGRS